MFILRGERGGAGRPPLGVDQDIPETGNPAPRDIRTLFLQETRDLLHSLADYLKVAYHCILRHRRVHERLTSFPGIILNPLYRLENMDEVEPVATHSGTVSRREAVPDVPVQPLLEHYHKDGETRRRRFVADRCT